jgi:hypothetical protein
MAALAAMDGTGNAQTVSPKMLPAITASRIPLPSLEEEVSNDDDGTVANTRHLAHLGMRYVTGS